MGSPAPRMTIPSQLVQNVGASYALASERLTPRKVGHGMASKAA